MSSPSAAPDSPVLPATEMPLGFDPTTRYSRQELFPGIGLEGQRRLRDSRVAIVGLGATGAVTASLLARAGVGFLRLIDRDFVEPSNLQRQILFDEADAAAVLPKAEAARRKLAQCNADAHCEAAIADLVPATAAELLGGVDLLLDATDNFETRYLLNDYAVREGVPWIYSAAIGAYAATMNILPKPAAASIFAHSALAEPGPAPYEPTACLACLLPEPPPGSIATCDTGGILAGAVSVAASIQSTEALKWLTGQPQLMRRTLLSFDLWQPGAADGLQRGELSAGRPDPDCLVCGKRLFRHLSGESRPQITLCGRNAVQIHEQRRPVALADLHTRLAAIPEVSDLRSNTMLLRFRRAGHTFTLFADGRAVIQGTTDPGIARSLYARYIGS